MPEYLAPGVYVEELEGIKTIEGVSTSTTGVAGVTMRGPIAGPPTLVTSFPEFQRLFGGYFDFGPTFLNHRYMPFAAEGFFNNGGKRLYVSRVAASGAGAPSAASAATTGSMITRLAAGVIVDAATAAAAFVTLRGIQTGTKFRMVMTKEGVTYTSNDITVTGFTPATGDVAFAAGVTINPAGPAEFESALTTVLTDTDTIDTAGANPGTLSPPLATFTSARQPSFTISAADPGSWGKDIVVQVTHVPGGRSEVDVHLSAGADTSTFRLKSAAGFYVDGWVELNMPTGKRYRRIRSVNGSAITVWGDSITAGQIPAGTEAVVCEFRITASYAGATEQFTGLTLEQVPGKYFIDVVNNSSNLLNLTWPGAPAAGLRHPLLIPSALDGLTITLGTGGSDGNPPTAADYRGTTTGAGLHTGIKALEDIEQISIIAAPGATDQLVQNALIEQCERLKYRFAILDPAPKAGDAAPLVPDVIKQRQQYDSKYAALYYPRVMAFDPIANTDIPAPPSGHMAGIYARTDIELGVHVAPANQVVRGIEGLELTINKENQDILNPIGVDVIRDFGAEGRGIRVWGARCITSDSEWKYVPVRRLFIFLENSLDQGTQWVVFLPNDEPLWERVKQAVTDFLTTVWRGGALQGTKAEEAFFVKVDRTTMTQNDIDNGRLIMIIGVAPVKPAEFVIIRIGQWAGGSQVSEG
jgi:phage tail sheath protein FI